MATAQSYDQFKNWCFGNSTDDQTIQGCETVIKSARETPANISNAFFNRGLSYKNKGQYDRAIEDYDQAIKLNPHYTDAFNNRGVAYKNKGQYDRAIQDYDQAIKLNPNFVFAFSNRGVAYGKKGQYDRAIEDYDQAIKLNPNYAESFNNRGIAYTDKGQYDRAIQDFDQAIKLNPNYALAFYNRGIAYGKKGQYDRAIQDYDQAIKLNPNDADAIKQRADAIAKQADNLKSRMNPDPRTLAEKSQAAGDASNGASTSGWSWPWRWVWSSAASTSAQQDTLPGFSLVGLFSGLFGPSIDSTQCDNAGDTSSYDVAISSCTELIKSHGGGGGRYSNRGRAYSAKKDYNHAIADYNDAIRLDPKHADGYYGRSLVNRSKGDMAAADADLAAARAINPNIGR